MPSGLRSNNKTPRGFFFSSFVSTFTLKLRLRNRIEPLIGRGRKKTHRTSKKIKAIIPPSKTVSRVFDTCACWYQKELQFQGAVETMRGKIMYEGLTLRVLLDSVRLVCQPTMILLTFGNVCAFKSGKSLIPCRSPFYHQPLVGKNNSKLDPPLLTGIKKSHNLFLNLF